MGWINDDTGKGSVDDYFLANPEAGNKCNDDAESCPDQSKPGGSSRTYYLNFKSHYKNTTILNIKFQVQTTLNYSTQCPEITTPC